MIELAAGVTPAGEGQDGTAWNVLGHRYFLKAECESMFCFETVDPPGTFVPPHIHPDQDEYLYILEGRLDFFPAGDVALQEGLRLADQAERRLSEKQLYIRAEAWRPHRGVAAHLLWAYYGRVKRGEISGALPI